MDDNNTKPKKKDKPGQKGRLAVFAENISAEFRKIVWPTRPELFKQTVVVIVISLVIGAIIFGMDTALSFFQRFISELT